MDISGRRALCTCFILGAYRVYWVLTECICGEARVAGPINLVTAAWGVNLITEAFQLFLSRMVERGGAYRWSCE